MNQAIKYYIVIIMVRESSENTLQAFVSTDGVLVIGAQQSQHKVAPESTFQFTGEISQLQIYRRAFSHVIIHTLSARCSSIPGNFFRWADMPANVQGTVHVRHQSDCFNTNNGQNG